MNEDNEYNNDSESIELEKKTSIQTNMDIIFFRNEGNFTCNHKTRDKKFFRSYKN